MQANHLEKLVEDRTKELEAKIAERQEFFDLMLGREIRMAELKKVINKLRQQIKNAGLIPVANDPLIHSSQDEPVETP